MNADSLENRYVVNKDVAQEGQDIIFALINISPDLIGLCL